MTVRITGMASGLDVDSLVQQIMKAQRTTYDNMVKKRTKVEWQQEDYRTMASKIVDFRNNKLASFNLSSAISAKTSELSGDTNAISINATASAAAGSLNVNVQKVATSGNQIYTYSATDKTASLADLGFTTDPLNANNVQVTINNQTVSVDKTLHLADLASAINSSANKLKATALYDEASGQFSLSATETGANKLNLDAKFANKGTASAPVNGQDAVVTVNGITYTQSSNKFSVNGFDFTAKNVSASGGTTITAKQDTDKIVDTIKSYVTEYNNLISAINSELDETVNRDYSPLSDDEKKEMSDDDIKMWQDKARSGSLHNDSTLSMLVSEMRTANTGLIAGIKDANGNPISIGITTGSYTEKGKLVLDESKLREALESNPDEVINLFTAKSSDTSPGSATSGVFAKLQTSTMNALTSMSTIAGTSLTSSDATAAFLENSLLSDQIRDMKSSESSMLDRLNDMEDQYYKQFSAMETAINNFNSQSSSLAGLLS
ncbi:flagellar filament capping protein FliD [Paenibacillus protaetiae]|uniref:Flagellar hook-associated protein 2 n=1 Tax=Paenibacillus protaetiae TaxID=2509456 RepID=A0A4P6F0X3_9BACL|nr:flagellar filament capping protein FliD [Paenibacillus protaetiae]QAY67759.1 flagellar cap protein FliD [Paenibacillus protaetiae]